MLYIVLIIHIMANISIQQTMENSKSLLKMVGMMKELRL